MNSNLVGEIGKFKNEDYEVHFDRGERLIVAKKEELDNEVRVLYFVKRFEVNFKK